MIITKIDYEPLARALFRVPHDMPVAIEFVSAMQAINDAAHATGTRLRLCGYIHDSCREYFSFAGRVNFIRNDVERPLKVMWNGHNDNFNPGAAWRMLNNQPFPLVTWDQFRHILHNTEQKVDGRAKITD